MNWKVVSDRYAEEGVIVESVDYFLTDARELWGDDVKLTWHTDGDREWYTDETGEVVLESV